MYAAGDDEDTIEKMAMDMKNCVIIEGYVQMMFINNLVEAKDEKRVSEIMSKWVKDAFKVKELKLKIHFILGFFLSTFQYVPVCTHLILPDLKVGACATSSSCPTVWAVQK